jgi:hypothetical protein
MNKKDLREQLRLEVVCPAKAKVLGGESPVTLMNSNYRYLRNGERSLWTWDELFSDAGLILQEELETLVAQEIGIGYSVRRQSFSGYLGVTSNTWYEVIKV